MIFEEKLVRNGSKIIDKMPGGGRGVMFDVYTLVYTLKFCRCISVFQQCRTWYMMHLVRVHLPFVHYPAAHTSFFYLGRDFRLLMSGSPATVSGSAGEVLASKSLRGKSKKAYTTADYKALLDKAKSKKSNASKSLRKMKGLKVVM